MAVQRLALLALAFFLVSCNTNMKQNQATERVTPAQAAPPASAAPPAPTAPPVAAKKPFQVTSPNGAREDEYYWLRDDTRKNPEMLAYVEAENAYADRMLA